MRDIRQWLAALLVAALAACSSAPPAEPGPDPSALPGAFSGELAWEQLEALAQEPRPLGSEGAEAARRRIRERLAELGIAAETIGTTTESQGYGPLALTHLAAALPGKSSDRIVLVAPYGSGQYDGFAFTGANDGASGAALLLELARVLAGHSLPYTLELVWLEGEGRLGHGSAEERELRWVGSQSLADHWAETGRLGGIRLLAVFNRVCDADLRIARDLGSHREHREAFWKAARRLGRAEAFPAGSSYETVKSSHEAFRKRGVRPVLAIEDTAFGGDEAPGLYAESEQDVTAHCAPESLEAVGAVAIEAVQTIAARLAKIDRFARTPSVQAESPLGGTPDPPRAETPDAAAAP